MDRDDERAIDPLTAADAWGNGWPKGWTDESIIELLEPMVIERRRRRILSVVEARIANVTVVMDAPHDPHNGAAVIRSCDAFGVQNVHVVPRTEEFLVSSGVTKGTERWVDVIVHASSAKALDELARTGHELVGTHPKGELLPAELAAIPRFALVLGNEHEGIGTELGRAISRNVRVPMRGMVESLNMSVSAAILLEASTRDRPGDLNETERRRLYARGLFRTVPRAAEVVDAAGIPGTPGSTGNAES